MPDGPPRHEIARTRIIRILRAQKVASARTLEQKISDAGPYNQRIDPHILTKVRNELEDERIVTRERRSNTHWYYLNETSAQVVRGRLAELEPIHLALRDHNLTTRMGQALEIAVYKALKSQSSLGFVGHFRDLDAHGDDVLYSKEGPPSSCSGRSIPGNAKLDFIAFGPGGPVGIECKNVREWLYPNRDEIRDMLYKCCCLDAVPVLIARRWPYVTFSVLWTCGVVLHQTYNQLLPVADAELATKAKDKTLLGYHDIRLGNEPDERLIRFVHSNLPEILPEARARFDEYNDLLFAYSTGEMDYPEFAARVKRRMRGEPEDLPPFEDF